MLWFEIQLEVHGAAEYVECESWDSWDAADEYFWAEIEPGLRGLRGEGDWRVWIHPHFCSPFDEECTCRQYDTDHHALYEAGAWIKAELGL